MNALPALAFAETFGTAYANSVARPAPLAPASPAPCDRLTAIAAGYVEVIEGWSCTVQDVIRLSTLAYSTANWTRIPRGSGQ